MDFTIVWKGNEHTNNSPRGKYVPFVIVNHISGGSMKSMDNWFTSAGNQVSSAHFGISKEGVIHQYVRIEDMAWHAGLKKETIKHAKAKVVHDMNINPNYYSIGIEHEGFDGNLTPIQFQASVWLHKYIKNYVKKKYNKDILLDNYHVIGHFQVDPIRKSFCPGPKFPWKALYETIVKEFDVPKKIKPSPTAEDKKPTTTNTTKKPTPKSLPSKTKITTIKPKPTKPTTVTKKTNTAKPKTSSTSTKKTSVSKNTKKQ